MNKLEQGNNSGTDQVPYNIIQHSLDNISLTSSEIGSLWQTYLADSMAKCMLPYFVEKSKDPDIRSVFQFALDISNQHVNSITEIFNKENFPVPHGFTEEDFDVLAEKLFSDSFILLYTRFEAKYGMVNFSLAFSNSVRPDICEFFEGCLNNSKEIHKKANDVLLSKGLLERTPNIAMPDRVEYVHNEQNFYKGLLGDKRPINVLEIEQCFATVQSKTIEKTMILGLSQVAKSKKIKDYLSRGKQIADKHIEILGSFLKDEDLSIPKTYDSQVTDSTESPFSDKLILFHITAFSSLSLAALGTALATCSRKDIRLTITRLTAEVSDYAKDGFILMIDQGWLERIPEAPNRKELRSH